MPLKKNTAVKSGEGGAGHLYVVATPIGNLEDLTFRAVKVLENSDRIAAEDTRHTGKLLEYYQIKTPLVSYHEHNEIKRAAEFIEKMKDGADIALVTDAGTPSVSDPGYRLVKAAADAGIKVIPVPGVSAAITALSVAGLPTDAFVFIGFAARKKGKRQEQLKNLALEKRTLIFYESPKRIIQFTEELMGVMGDRRAVLAREMTKLHEEFVRGNLSEIKACLEKREVVKGECTLVVEGAREEGVSMDLVLREIRDGLKKSGVRPSSLARELAAKFKMPKRKIYEEVLKMSGGE